VSGAAQMKDTIGFIGPGRMGEPMVQRLLQAGHQVLTYARRAAVRDRLLGSGAIVASSVAEVGAGSAILISCLFSDDQLRQTALGPKGFIAAASPKCIFVSHTTGTLATLSNLAKAGPPAPVILDAPVSGTAEHIREGKLTVLIGGPQSAVNRVTPVLSAYANPVIATGALGSALKMKLINNVLFSANVQLVAAAVDVAAQLGLDPMATLEAVAHCSGASDALTHTHTAGGVAAFEARITRYLAKDFAAAQAAAGSFGTDLGLLASVVRAGPLELHTASP
jgi:3-hydroxyisobutyrate dehydrogenase-like beta-hydroxyacid dehydrogenase